MVFIFSFSLLLTFMGCANNGDNSANQVVKGVDLAATNVNGDVVIKAGVLLYLKNILLAHLDMPIFNPKDPSRPYGRIVITPPLDFNGVHKVAFELNLSKIAPIPPIGEPLLPNGRELPFTGIDNSKVIMLEIDAIKSRIYFALDSNLSFMGFAIVISQFDAVGDYTGGIDFFPLFKFSNIIGTAGLFSGVENNQSGLAFFVNLSSVLSPSTINDILNGHKVYNLADRSVSYKTSETDLKKIKESFRTNISKGEEQEVLKALYKLTQKKRHVDYVPKH